MSAAPQGNGRASGWLAPIPVCLGAAPWGQPLGLGSAHLCGLAYAPPWSIPEALFTNTGQKPPRSPCPQPYKSDILGLNVGLRGYAHHTGPFPP